MRFLWTDFGGVLTPPSAESNRAFCAAQGIPEDAFMAAVRKVAQPFGGDLMVALDTPLITQDEWSRRVARALAEDAGIETDLSDFPATFFADRRVNQEWLDFLHSVRARGIFVGLLSNMVPAWDPYWRQMVPPADVFDDVVLSFEVGARKPTAAIFELAAARAGAAPSACVLVDDLAANCEGARAAGWNSVRFSDTTAAVAQVEALLSVPVPLSPGGQR